MSNLSLSILLYSVISVLFMFYFISEMPFSTFEKDICRNPPKLSVDSTSTTVKLTYLILFMLVVALWPLFVMFMLFEFFKNELR